MHPLDHQRRHPNGEGREGEGRTDHDQVRRVRQLAGHRRTERKKERADRIRHGDRQGRDDERTHGAAGKVQSLGPPPLARSRGTVIRCQRDEDEREGREGEQHHKAQHEWQWGELREHAGEEKREGEPGRRGCGRHRTREPGIRRNVVLDEARTRRSDREAGSEPLQGACREQPADVRCEREQHR